jgi:hypothetical protein
MARKEIKKLHETNELVGGIHDGLLDTNLGLAEAYDDACVWIAELYLELEQTKKGVSSGYVRTDTRNIVRKPKSIAAPVDDADSWIKGA